ncbi:MAG TPA: PQQ-binding-like beta-propeller repeat protein [Actinomycetota bacterium]|nr:PQQ-binding-like beta-propeller repeat protein [Actinomycetota bacterium]
MTALHRRTASASCLLLFFLFGCTGRAATTSTVTPPTGGAAPTSTAASPATSASQLRIVPAGYRLPAPVQRAVAVSFGGSVYIAGGLDATGNSAAGVFRLDPANGRITSIGSLPQSFHDGAGAVIGHSLFVFGGGTARSSAAVQAIDLPTGRSRMAGTLPSPLSDLAAATVGSTVYVLGGWNGVTPQPTIWATSNGTTFRRAGALPTGLRYPAVATNGTDLLIAGGVLAGGRENRTVYRFDTTSGRTSILASLPAPVGHAMAFVERGVLYVVGGLDPSGAATSSVTEVVLPGGTPIAGPALAHPLADAAVAPAGAGHLLIGGSDTSTLAQVSRSVPVAAADAAAPTGDPSASVASASSQRPFAGLLLIADRGNDRLIVVDRHRRIVWRYPSPNLPAPKVPFYFPDDAFWVHGGHAILVNEEENDVIAEIAYPSGRTIWTYGHPRVAGSSAGYLHQPDDAYPYPFGRDAVVVADAKNCRLLFFGPSGRADRQIGVTGNCSAGLPRTVGYPNASTPLSNGDLLTTELYGGVVARVRPSGAVVWQHRIPGLGVPSDPQMLPDGSILAVDYGNPGGIVRFRPDGRVVWTYHARSAAGALDRPSLGAPLPNGLIAVNDDENHRVVLIDPATDRIVWQYGVTGVPGRTAGHLNTPDGLDLLLPGGVIPLHTDFPSSLTHVGRP